MIKALKNGASKRAIRDLLGGLRVDHMGMRPNLKADGQIAKEIYAAWTKMQGERS